MYGDLGIKLVQHAKRTQALEHLPPYQAEMVRAVTKEVTELDEDVAQILAQHGGGDGGGGFDPSAAPAAACALLVDHLCMRRNKRCLLAYHRVRCDKLEEMCWRGVDVDVLEQAGAAEDVALPGLGPGALPQEAPLAPQPPPPPQQQIQQQEQQEQQQQEKLADKRQGATTGPDASAAAAVADADGGVGSLSADEEEYVRQYSDLLAAYKGQWTDIDLTGPLEPPRDLFIDVRVLRDAGEIQTEYGSITLSKNSQFYVRKGDVERLIAQGYLQRLS